jgi:outer membrane protein assembly factor BamB
MPLLQVLGSSALLLLGALLANAAESWPEFRGPTGQGHAAAAKLPTEWSETKNIQWKTPLPGKGWSSPVAADGVIWLTAAIDSPLTEEQKKEKLKSNTGDQPLNVAGHVDLYVLGIDQQTGKLLHQVKVLGVDDPQWIHTLNSYASPTPVLENGKLYCHFGALGNVCFDTKSLQNVWTNSELQIMHENGPGSTPVIWGGLMIFHCDGSDIQYIAALDKQTGKIAWKTPRTGEMHNNPQLKKAYGTPLIVRQTEGNTTREILLSPAANWLYAYDPATGRELWKLNYGTLGFSIVPRPVMGNGLFYLCTTYMKSELLAVKLPALNEAAAEPVIAWRHKKSVPNIPSPLLVGDEIYFVHDNGVATCLDAASGKEAWSERLGGKYCSSPVYADGKIYLSSREGQTLVIKPGKKFEKLATNSLDGEIMASSMVLDNSLFIRTDKALYRIGETPVTPK